MQALDKFCRECGAPGRTRNAPTIKASPSIGHNQDKSDGHCPDCGGEVKETISGKGVCVKCWNQLEEVDSLLTPGTTLLGELYDLCKTIFRSLPGWWGSLDSGKQFSVIIVPVVAIFIAMIPSLSKQAPSRTSAAPQQAKPSQTISASAPPMVEDGIESSQQWRGKEHEAIEFVKHFHPQRGSAAGGSIEDWFEKMFRVSRLARKMFSTGATDKNVAWRARYEHGAVYRVTLSYVESEPGRKPLKKIHEFYADLQSRSVTATEGLLQFIIEKDPPSVHKDEEQAAISLVQAYHYVPGEQYSVGEKASMAQRLGFTVEWTARCEGGNIYAVIFASHLAGKTPVAGALPGTSYNGKCIFHVNLESERVDKDLCADE